MHEGPQLAHELRAIGVQGYVSKTDAVTTLPEAIDAVLDGATFFGVKVPRT
jgi:DNA-binding NarL/FixJ family response regulator